MGSSEHTRRVPNTGHAGMGRRLKHGCLSVFIIVNLGSVVFMNRPPVLDQAAGRVVDESHSPQLVYRMRWLGWLIHRYANLVGLDNRWQMFSHNSRFEWWYVIEARLADDTTVVLPLPRQSSRTFWQRALFDFREAKFHLNVYSSQRARSAYADYLCRRFPEQGEQSVRAIVWQLHHRRILEPGEAQVRRTHLDDQSFGRVLDVFSCASDGRER